MNCLEKLLNCIYISSIINFDQNDLGTNDMRYITNLLGFWYFRSCLFSHTETKK